MSTRSIQPMRQGRHAGPGGLTTLEAQRLIRDLKGHDFLGADLVEVSPPYDTGGITSMTAATILFAFSARLRRPASNENPCRVAPAAPIWTDPRRGRTIPAPGAFAEGGHSACQRR